MCTWQPGARIGPYTLLSGIGAGAMGEVWKARDERLNRFVAIKRVQVRSEAVAREARAIAALNHPHICTLHDIGPDYLVMEYLEGTTLSGPLDPPEATRLGLQIVSALEAAHGKGITHRDLKPANVLVSGGRAKLLDFGIASVHDASAPDATMTVGGTITGTPYYMAPEQVQGKPADTRSDIFSFGAVLYEMLSGRRAFDAHSTSETLAAVLRDDPPALQAPEPLTRIVRRCLEKSPARRYQSAAELRLALEEASSARPDVPSIAVLPFANLSSDREQEYFSDGLTEEIINALARVPGLKIIARTSAFAFKGQNVPIGRIADALGVNTILEGSVRRAANRVRVTAQLISAGDGCQLWSDRYDRELADVFAVQDDIASAIVHELRGRLGGRAPSPRAQTPGVEAYEAYLMARHRIWRFDPDFFEQGRKYDEQAIALDPGFALPHLGLAELFHIRASGTGADARAAADLVRPAAQRALALDPSLAEAHAWLGICASTYDYDWQAAERHFEQGAATGVITPRFRHVRGYFYLRFVGRADEGVSEHERALQEDPLNLIMRVGLVACLRSAGRLAAAAREAQRLAELDPEFAAQYTLLALDVPNTPLQTAIAFAERAISRAPWNTGPKGLLAGLLRRNGDDDQSAALLRTVGDPNEYGHALDFALYHLASGEMDRAFDYLASLAGQHHPFLMMILVGGPYGPMLRASPRWPAFAATIGLSA